MNKDKIIISAALTGAATNRSHCPHIPYTPEELGKEAKRAVDAGASIVHIHAREDNGVPSWRTEVFENITNEVRKRCPEVIINYSTGAIGLSVEQRTAHLAATKPEMAAFNMGSMNYAIFSKRKKQFLWSAVLKIPSRPCRELSKLCLSMEFARKWNVLIRDTSEMQNRLGKWG